MSIKRKAARFASVRVDDLTVSQVVAADTNYKLATATSMDGVTIGATTPAAATFTTLNFGTRSITTHDYAGGNTTWTLTTAEARGLILSVTNAGVGAAQANLPASTVGLYILKNASGQTVTLIVAGGSGIAVANAKYALLLADGTNVVRVTADT